MFELLAAGAALAGRAMLQAADAALLAIGEDEIREREATHPRQARWLLKLKQHPEPTAAALRGASSSLLAFAAVACAIVVGDELHQRTGLDPWARTVVELAAGVIAGGIALILDLAPRSLAAANPLEWGFSLAGYASFVSLLLGPPMRVLLRLFDALLFHRGVTARYTPPPPPLQEIEKILSDEARGGTSNAPAPELVHGLFTFAERTAKELMVPRTRVIGLPLDATPDEVIRLLAEEGHTRMPVYEDDLDHIRGVLHTKDLIPLLAHPELIKLQDVLRPPLFVPWTKPVAELLREMQTRRSLLALVVDEYGGFLGIVTLEDLLEEIVGDIREEGEPDVPAPAWGADGTALVRGDMRVDDLNRALAAGLPEEGDYETVGGLLNAFSGAIPQVGDRLYVGGLELTVVHRDERRVRLVRLSRPKAGATQPPSTRA